MTMAWLERVFTAFLGVAVLVASVGAVAYIGYVLVDDRLYVSDDVSLGRQVSPFNNPEDLPLRKGILTENELAQACWDLAREQGYSSGRANRHFLFGCNGQWPGPPAAESGGGGGD